MNEMRKLMESIQQINESFSGLTYDGILNGFDTSRASDAVDYARGIVWSEIDTSHNNIKYSEYIDTVNGVDVYYDYGADYYFFAPDDMDEYLGEQAANPVDTITVDVPLLIRLLEFAREDAKTDMDLHSLADNLINLSPEGNTLTMADYEELVAGLAGDPDHNENGGGYGHENALGNDHNPSYQNFPG